MQIIQCGICDVGLKRQVNQDSILILSNFEKNMYLYVVADGMGGHSHGEIASNMITSELRDWWDGKELNACGDDFRNILLAIQNKLKAINGEIFSKYNNETVCGSTCILLFIYDKQYAIISAGDSRVYMKRGLNIKSVMTDDVWENQSSIREKLLIKQIREHKNYGKLINAVGTSSDVNLSMKADNLKINDTFILCSDGLYKYCSYKYLKRVIRNVKEKNISECVNMLLGQTYVNEAKDNISIIIVKVIR